MFSSHNFSTQLSLLQRVQSERGHTDWNDLLRYYEPFVRWLLDRIGVRAARLDDVTQKVLTRLWFELENYQRDEKTAKFRTWLVRLARNVAIDDYRKQKREKRLGNQSVDEVDLLLSEPPAMDAIIEHQWQRHVVDLAFKRLENIFSGKAIEVVLRTCEGETPEQISESLGLTVSSVYVLRNRVKKRLLQEVAQLRMELERSNRHDE